ncbi:hypothetical protein Tco_1091457 [Tanacetum coccineum]|uniref:MAK10-like protein n=1 Tax=Tanacetum coccineum TaxID=301880 RepID=A0ABQ5I8A5_9ASTR
MRDVRERRVKGHRQKVPPFSIDRWLQTQILYDHVSFHLKCEIDRVAGGKLLNKNSDGFWEIIENLALYDHEGWNDMKELVKPVKSISTLQGISKMPDQRLLELEDQINFILNRSRNQPLRAQHTSLMLHAKHPIPNRRTAKHNEP